VSRWFGFELRATAVCDGHATDIDTTVAHSHAAL
jgi:hypothetical protein